jgi:hypothetical protein
MATGRVPTTANSPLTAKGDLFGYSTTQARVAVGNDGETLVADSSTSTGLRYTAGTVQANPVLNSAFQIWQRGTSNSGATGGGAYVADRWSGLLIGGVTQTNTYSRQATGDTTNLPNIQYCLRSQRTSGQTGTSTMYITQSFETVNSIPFAGKTVTLSFYARAGANYSSASNALSVNLASGTGTDQNLNGGFTGYSLPINSTATLTTTWQRFTFTGSVNAAATQLGIAIFYVPTGTAGAADFYEITGVQIDIGSVALPFRTYAGTIQGELAACQRYYYTLVAGTNGTFGTAGYYSSSDVLGTVFYPVQMRTAPTFSAAAGSFYEVVRNGAANALTGLSANYLGQLSANIFAGSAQGASGTAGHAGQYRTTSASANIAFSAEL